MSNENSIFKPLKSSLSINGDDYHPVIFEQWYHDIELTGQKFLISCKKIQPSYKELQKIVKIIRY